VIDLADGLNGGSASGERPKSTARSSGSTGVPARATTPPRTARASVGQLELELGVEIRRP